MIFFDNVYVMEGAVGYPLTGEILDKLGTAGVPISDLRDIPEGERGERNLVLAAHRGRIVKNCPGTANHICCGYHVINQVLGCDVDCTYCILNCYINAPGAVINVNLGDTISELDRTLSNKRKYIYRVGTGELTDSFYLDRLTGLAAGFVKYFADKEGVLFELKTKKTDIDSILGLDHKGRTIISWSLNAGPVAKSEEAGAASITERLEAAGRAQKEGYWIGFHFDPMVHYNGWEAGYEETAGAIFDYVDPKKVLWISLGTFRSPPRLFEIIRERHPESGIVTGESFPGDDGKLRYLKPLRIEMYRRLLESLKKHGGDDLFVYLCMERRDVWEKVYGGASKTPKNSGNLNKMFHENLKLKWKVGRPDGGN